ncbi:MAG TPA: amylo-alpha-1,6-glucosidase [Saprospiraceae bacterium]|nr:amylo-alpha-1,6-glucosidase [Saprospiraceae bacterium]HMP24012.1 amylo-alpha-1,6-glucosidase [Saprospiraceae bacterium]
MAHTYEELAAREWLITNGLGGYASSTIIGANTRRYHGLLIAAFNPPADRRVLVSKVEETVHLNGEVYPLSTNRYPGVIHPRGFEHWQGFTRQPLPRTTFTIAQTGKIHKTVFMPYGQNATIVEYENAGSEAIVLKLNPLLVYRDYHSLFAENEYFNFFTEQREGNLLKIHAHYGAPPLFVHFSKGNFQHQPVWFKNLEYEVEQARGLDFHEDAKSIGSISVELAAGEQCFLVFTLESNVLLHAPETWKQEEINRLRALEPATEDTFLRDLVVAGHQFLVHRQSTNSATLIAGYHWFTDWGRDTMIAMRGLTIATRKQEISQAILRTFLQYLDQGMLPNRFPDQGETPEYNTSDATLWLFIVLYEYYEQFQDLPFITEVFPRLTEILNLHIQGTRYHIHVTPEGLLFGGEGLAQLTWMDAKVGDYVVTPRQGCPVEINALWYNALQIYIFFAAMTKQKSDDYAALAKKAKIAFRQYFINDQGYLNDVIIPDGYVDASVRPNQIYAISLPFPLLTKKEAQTVLNVVEKKLYTDYGLRSLDEESAEFRGFYGGDQWQRDTAYHQGTVWAFLWGEYALAYLKNNGYSEKTGRHILTKMKALKHHFYEENCLHGISEIFDGEHPQQGKGCIQQAWSVGMLVKVLMELQNRKIL